MQSKAVDLYSNEKLIHFSEDQESKLARYCKKKSLNFYLKVFYYSSPWMGNPR